ncbi:hypothetical protein O6H91_11G001000 [Diphasiastrum complanatum]|uniref:Uncharacterized protein n=1 Tax=Diphasiastrum complanatum TaxID=34168 RepID=A0ACC2C5Q7_DIPCM|nr:hypothetical protein O6H91_11G001000 [Diphasiastrum complanatum]
MAVKISPLTPAIGAIIEGISLSDPLPDAQLKAIREALLEHQVIFFTSQAITPRQQHAFAKRFGDLHIHPIYANLGPELEEVMVLDSDGDHPPDNDIWHTDVSFIKTPPLGTILATKELPPSGGDTLWSSGIAAFEALSKPMQAFLLELKAEHNFLKSFSKPRYHYEVKSDPKAMWEEAVRKNPPVVHPVVRTHPETQRKALFVNKGHTTRIVNLSKAESDAVLEFLFAHAARPEFTMRWRWQVGDVGFWDNRVTQHYGVADYLPHRRLMHRVTILGDKPY